jgi:hypothetical protein
MYTLKVVNIHERELHASFDQVGALIDTLASNCDALWPVHSWPPMKFDRPLSQGATGGHGPIRYRVEEYLTGQSVKFRFTGPKYFDGWHRFEVVSQKPSAVILRHKIEMSAHGIGLLTWPLLFAPLHDALLEDSLATAQAALGEVPQVQTWSPWVKLLRWLLSGGKARRQVTSDMLTKLSR